MAKAKRTQKPVTPADIRKAQADVLSAAIAFNAEWQHHALTDTPVWEAANAVAHAARRLRRLSQLYVNAKRRK